MEQLSVRKLLEAYIIVLGKNEISFVANAHPIDQENIKSLVADLHSLFVEADKEDRDVDWYAAHEKGTNLWRVLIRLSLNFIDDTSKGNARLIEFLNSATKFEDGLYGLDEHYRDHTLHSLWVYLLGDYLLRGSLVEAYKDLNWYIWNDVQTDPDWESLRTLAKKKEKILSEEVNRNKDAIWCVTALCHDIGYSLSKLGEINRRVEDVLSYLDLHGFDRVGYGLRIEHQYLANQFLELVTNDVRLEADSNASQVVAKLYRDDHVYWQLCDALERREHGTLSAFILYKLLGLFGDATTRGPAEEWGLDDEEAQDTLIRGSILFAMAQHTLQYIWANELGSLADILLLADDLEEFTRWPARPLLNRKYRPTVAEVSVGFDFSKKKEGKCVAIKIDYVVHEDDDLADFFWRKADRLVKVYDLETEKSGGRQHIGRPRHQDRFLRIASIDLTARKVSGSQALEVHIDVEGDKKAVLPSEKDAAKSSVFQIQLIDDAIHVIDNATFVPLKKWLDHSQNGANGAGS